MGNKKGRKRKITNPDDAVLNDIILDFAEGIATISDDRGGSGDIKVSWDAMGTQKPLEWTVDDLKGQSGIGKNIKAPVRFNEDTGNPYLPMPERVWRAIRQVIAVFE
jgi:hypothetical protein